MSLYREVVVSSLNRNTDERYKGTGAKDPIKPLFLVGTPAEKIPADLAQLLTDERYPLLTTLHERVDPAASIVDKDFADSPLETRVNMLMGLLFYLGFNTENQQSTQPSQAATKSLSSLSLLFNLTTDQVILRKDQAFDDSQFESSLIYMEAEYKARLKKHSKSTPKA